MNKTNNQKKVTFGYSIDKKIKDIIDKKSKETMISKSTIVNEIFKKAFEEELKDKK